MGSSIPCHSQRTRPTFHRIALNLIFCCLFIPYLLNLSFASEAEPTQEDKRTSSATESATAVVQFPTVYFQRNSMSLDQKAMQSLKPLIAYLKNHPDVRIRLSGHVDERRSQAYGLVLSSKWADVVKKHLREHGVTNPIDTIGYGTARPFCIEHNEACWRVSNRVQIVKW